MENTPNNTESTEKSAEPRKHSLGTRLLVAYGFSTLGAKLAGLGLPFDVNGVFRGENLTLKQKFARIKDGSFAIVLTEKLESGMLHDLAGQKNPSAFTIMKAQTKALIKLTKFSTGLGVIGTVAGAVIGWKRGGLIEDWHDTVKHPIDSTKVILGLAKPEILDKYRTTKKVADKKQVVDTTETSKQENSKSWANEIKAKPESKVDGVLSARSEAAKSPALG